MVHGKRQFLFRVTSSLEPATQRVLKHIRTINAWMG